MSRVGNGNRGTEVYGKNFIYHPRTHIKKKHLRVDMTGTTSTIATSIVYKLWIIDVDVDFVNKCWMNLWEPLIIP